MTWRGREPGRHGGVAVAFALLVRFILFVPALDVADDPGAPGAAAATPERSGAGIEPTPRRAATGNRF
jgi:hypothetical protein